MKANGLPVTYVVYPDEGHIFVRLPNQLSRMAITEAFLGRCLGGRVEPFAGDLSGSSAQIETGAEHIPGLQDARTHIAPAHAIRGSNRPLMFSYVGRCRGTNLEIFPNASRTPVTATPAITCAELRSAHKWDVATLITARNTSPAGPDQWGSYLLDLLTPGRNLH